MSFSDKRRKTSGGKVTGAEILRLNALLLPTSAEDINSSITRAKMQTSILTEKCPAVITYIFHSNVDKQQKLCNMHTSINLHIDTSLC